MVTFVFESHHLERRSWSLRTAFECNLLQAEERMTKILNEQYPDVPKGLLFVTVGPDSATATAIERRVAPTGVELVALDGTVL